MLFFYAVTSKLFFGAHSCVSVYHNSPPISSLFLFLLYTKTVAFDTLFDTKF